MSGPKTDPREMSYADAQMIASHLWMGDRAKLSWEQARTYCEAASKLLERVSLALGLDADAPILPAVEHLRAIEREARAWRRCDLAADALADKGDDAAEDEEHAGQEALGRLRALLEQRGAQAGAT